ncbi:unnamed protein product [Schistosoma turkestanicum]|nr:unnamed protein product [Schistosoma turkestanicum]
MKWIYYVISLFINHLICINSTKYHEVIGKNSDELINSQEDNDQKHQTDQVTTLIEPVMTDEQRLLSKILNGYDTASRPTFNASKSVQVGFQFTLIQISQLEWIDERLTWDPQDYNNLSRIRIPCQKLWLPDIVLYNSADDYKTDYMQSKAMVQSNGNVFWPPPAKLRSTCKIDITYFPFDDQSCTMKFGSWTYDGWQVNVIKRHDEVDISNYVENGEWDLLKVVVERHEIFYPCCDEPYPDLRFTIYMRRRTLYYLFNIIFPCLWLTVLSLVSFWLPPDSGEKITLGITVLLAFSVFMLLIAENMPATSEFVPLIGVYLTVTMAMTSLSIILTVLVLHLHHTGSNRQPVPKYVRKIFFHYIAKILCLNNVQRYQIKRNQSLKMAKHSKLMLDQIKSQIVFTDNNNDDSTNANLNIDNNNDCFINKTPISKTPSQSNKTLLYHNYLPSDVIRSTRLTESKKPIVFSNYTEKYFTTNHEQDDSTMNESTMNRMSSPDLNTLQSSTFEQTPVNQPKNIHVVQIVTDTNDRKSNSNKKSTEKLIHSRFKHYEMSYDYRTYYTKSSDDLNDHFKSINPLKKSTPHSNNYQPYKQDELRLLKQLSNILMKAEQQQQITQIYLHNLCKKQCEEQYISDLINEWRILAVIVDRLLFWLFLAIAVIATIVILLIMPLFKPTYA